MRLDPPINSRNWISCVRLDNARIAMVQTGNKTEMQASSWPSVLSLIQKWSSWQIVSIAAAATKSFSNTKVKHLWGCSFFCKLFLLFVVTNKLRGFFSGMVLNWGYWKTRNCRIVGQRNKNSKNAYYTVMTVCNSCLFAYQSLYPKVRSCRCYGFLLARIH